MFELLAVFGIILIAAAAITRRELDRDKSVRNLFASVRDARRASQSAKSPQPVPAAAESAPAVGDASHRVPRDARFAFVSSFGLRPEQLRELHIYAVAGRFEEFPQKVADLLRKLYANGFAVGGEIMGLLHHGRPLKEGEAIYVAVVQDDSVKATRTIAFLDRHRTC